MNEHYADLIELEQYDKHKLGIETKPDKLIIIYKNILLTYDVIQVEHIFMETNEVVERYLTGGNEMVKVPVSAKYLSREDFETEELGVDNDTLKGKIVDEGWIVPASESKWNKEQFKITIQLETKEERIANLNNTSRELLIAGYGEDSKGWVDKPIVLKGDERKIDKKMQYVITVRPKEIKVK